MKITTFLILALMSIGAHAAICPDGQHAGVPVGNVTPCYANKTCGVAMTSETCAAKPGNTEFTSATKCCLHGILAPTEIKRKTLR